MNATEYLPRLPVRDGKIKVDLTGVYPRKDGAPVSCEVELFHVPTEAELYGNKEATHERQTV